MDFRSANETGGQTAKLNNLFNVVVINCKTPADMDNICATHPNVFSEFYAVATRGDGQQFRDDLFKPTLPTVP